MFLRISWGLKSEFQSAMINETSVFEASKFTIYQCKIFPYYKLLIGPDYQDIFVKSCFLYWLLQVNLSPAEPRYVLPLQTVQLQKTTWPGSIIYVCHLVCECISTIWIKYSDWLKNRIRNGHGILIYSAEQGLRTYAFAIEQTQFTVHF